MWTMIAARAPLLLISLAIGCSTLPGQWRCQALRLKWPSLRPSPGYPLSRPSFDRLGAVQTTVASPPRRPIIESQKELQQGQDLEDLQEMEFRLPPDDGTFSLLPTLREIWYGPGVNKNREARYATMMRTTTGVWRSRLLGLFPYAVVSAPAKTAWITQQESMGKIIMGVPRSMERLLGEKSSAGLEKGSRKEFDAVKRILNESLSPEAVISMQPLVERVLNRYVSRWQRLAEEQKEIVFVRDAATLTLEIAIVAIFGDAAGATMDELLDLVPTFTSCLVSMPLRFPWPLSRIQIFSYGRGLATRKKLLKVLNRAIDDRRAVLASRRDKKKNDKKKRKEFTSVLDRFLLEQLEQSKDGQANGRDVAMINNELICDNIISLLWAGRDTTAISLSRVLQYLGGSEGVDARKAVEKELSQTSIQDISSSTIRPKLTGAHSGLFSALPVLSSVVLESSRLTPVVPCTFRTAVKDLKIDGFTIPAGQRLAWAPMTTYRSRDLYESPDSFCPFRFLHGRKPSPLVSDWPAQNHGGDGLADLSTQSKLVGMRQGELDGAAAPESPPPIFGFGRHMCPGRELAKLEHICILRRLLLEFDYRVVEGQNFRETLPLNAPKDGLRLLLSPKKTTATDKKQADA